jgi:sulfoxide reductase heme-binding subunit YedZ
MALWTDRRGRFSPLRAAALVMLLFPTLLLLHTAYTVGLGPRPINEAMHFIGQWTVRFLIVVLMLTPLRRLARWPQLVDVRRMIGVGTFCYIAVHLALYIVDQAFNIPKVISEIVLRIYLTIGFVAWIGLAVIAATSNDYMVRRLGGIRWKKLHRLVYPIVALGLIHHFMQAKQDVTNPTILAGIFGWLMFYRAAHWTLPRSFMRSDGELPLWFIAVLGIVSAALTFILEAVGLSLAHGVSPWLVLQVNLDFSFGPRPGWYVLAFGLAMFLIALVRLKPERSFTQLASSAGRTPS